MERLSILYASALFEIALEKGIVDEFLDQASLTRDMLQDAGCQRILEHPHISEQEKKEFFRMAFAGHIHDDMLGLLFLVAEKNRENYLLPALTALIDMIKRYKRQVTASVFTAETFDGKQVSAMKEMLSRKLDKTVDISLKVDPSIIGGPYIFVDGYYLDWTVKKRLRDLTVHMKEGCSA